MSGDKTVWDAIAQHLPHIADRVTSGPGDFAVAAAVGAEERVAAGLSDEGLRSWLREEYGMSDDQIRMMGGPLRAHGFMRVVNRAEAMARSGGGTFGACVDSAARSEGVTLSEEERGRAVLVAARLSLAFGKAPK